MSLKGKKGFCFVALKHHSRFLLPITRILEEQGVELRYLTAAAELPFELTLMDEGLPYCHPFSNCPPDVAEKTELAYRRIRREWREKVLTSSVLHHFTLPVQDKVLRMHVENFYLFRHLFETERPDFVLALHELNSWGKMLSYLSQEYTVPCITLQEGLYYAPAAIYRFHTEYSSACLVWGDATREVLTRSGGCADKIFVVGNTHLATAITDATQSETLSQTRQALAIKSGHKVVTILMGGLGYHDEFSFPPALLDWARKVENLTIICKWHPVSNKTVLERIQQPFQQITALRSVQQYDTYNLLAVSDVCVVFGNSTTGLEALAFGKPLIEVYLPGSEYSFAALGVADSVADLAQVPMAVERLLREKVSSHRKHNVKEYLDRNLGPTLHGGAVSTAVATITQILSAHDEHRRHYERIENAKSGGASHNPEIRVGRRDDNINTEQNSHSKETEYVCSIIIPVLSSVGLVETLMGIATHTSEAITYECILSSADPERLQPLLSGIGGDIRLVHGARPNLGHLCNMAARAAKGQYLCFLSPGVIPQAAWLETLLKELAVESSGEPSSYKRTGLVGGKVVFADGRLAHAGVVFDANCSPSLLYRLLPSTFDGTNKVRLVPAVTGCILVDRDVFVTVDGMDEEFQQGWHEIDLCLQAQRAGWQTKYTPHSQCIALGAAMAGTLADRLRFYSKWVGRLWPNEEEYWHADGLDNKTLQRLYQAQMD